MTAFVGFLRLLWRYDPTRAWGLAFLAVAVSLSDGIGVMLLVPLIALIEERAGGSGALDVLPEWLPLPQNPSLLVAMLVAVIAARAGLVFSRQALAIRLQLDVTRDLRNRLVDIGLSADWAWLAGQRGTDRAALILHQAQRVQAGLGAAISILSTAVVAALYLIIALGLSVPLTLGALLTGAGMAIALRRQHRASKQLGVDLNTSNTDMQHAMAQGLDGLHLTRALGRSDSYRGEMDQIFTRQNAARIGFVRVSAGAVAVFQVLVAILLGALLILGARGLGLELAALAVFVVIIARVAPLIQKAQTQANTCLNSWPAYREIRDFLREGSDHTKPPEGQADLPNLQESLRAEQLSLQIDPGSAVLQEVSFDLPFGQMLAITGPSGSGKTSLAHVITGQLPPTAGRIYVDGRALDLSTADSWRRQIGYVPQTPFFLSDTVRRNLAWVAPEATEPEMKAALQASAAEFVFGMAQGLDTEMGDQGARMSGGERQRIALARALLMQPRLLVLDEPTSALDADTEAQVIQTLRGLKGRTSLIVITHSTRLIELADQVLDLSKGPPAP